MRHIPSIASYYNGTVGEPQALRLIAMEQVENPRMICALGPVDMQGQITSGHIRV